MSRVAGARVIAAAALFGLSSVEVVAESIVFSSNRDVNDEIYTMDTDGSNQTRITSNANTDYQPSWAPGGGQIVFATDRDGNVEIYTMNADGSGQTNISNNAGSDVQPYWSPDGTKIAFNSNRTGNTDIFVMNADGSGVTQLTTDTSFDQFPVWSPDGTQIAWASFRSGDWEIWVMDSDGSGKTNITNDAGTDQYPSWSPDGSRMAFCSVRGGDGDFEVYTMNSDGTGQTRITNNAVQDVSPWWSPDGSRIIYATNATSNNEVYSINPDGSDLQNLTNNAAGDQDGRWSWGSPANYRSIGTDAATLHSAGTGTMSLGTTTLTFAGTTLPSNVGLGDRIQIQGKAAIVREESVTGAGDGTSLTMPLIQDGTDQTYVLLIGTRFNDDVTAVTGGVGLTWAEQVEQCAGGGGHGTRIWTAQGSPTAPFQVQITTDDNNAIAASLLRYSGVSTITDPTGQNTNGESGGCSGGTDDKSALLTLTSTVNRSVHVIGVNAGRRNMNSTTPADYTEVNNASHGTGANRTSIYAVVKTFNPGATELFQGNINVNADWATAGIVLNPGPYTGTYYVKSRDSDTQVTIHNGAGGYHEAETYTITRAYNTLQAWEDDRQGDLVAIGRREVGVCYNDGVFSSPLTISGSTTNDSSYMQLTVAQGQRHTGLYSTGARMDAPGGTFGGDAITVEDEYTRIEWLLIEGVTDYEDAVYFSASPPADNSLVSNVLVHSFWQGGNATFNIDATGVTVRNCVATGGTTYAVLVGSLASATVENCTFWGYFGGGYGVYTSAGDVSVRNTISVDHGNLDIYIETNGSATVGYFGYNMFTTTGGGFDPDDYDGGNQSPPASFEDLFISLTTPIDLHLHPTGHTAIDNGLDLSSVFTDDMDGQGRGRWDIGADEVFYNYRSIGTNAATIYSTGTASVEAGSTNVTFSSGASLPTNVGRGDEITIGADQYFLTARNSATSATIHTPATRTHAHDTFTIDRAYNSFQSWETAREGDLVGESRREAGVAYNDGTFTPGSLIEIDGSTTDASHFMMVTVAESHRHAGVADTGICVLVDGGGSGDIIQVKDQYTVIEWLTMTNIGSDGIHVFSSTGDGTLLRNLILYAYNSGTAAVNMQGDATVRNTIIYDGTDGILVQNGAVGTIENVTIFDMATEGVDAKFSATSVAVRNTIAVDCLVDMEIACAVTYFGYNMYSTYGGGFDPSAHEGNNQAPPADRENLFVSIFPTAEDLQLEATGHSAGNTGVDMSTAYSIDVAGTARTGDWDIGADEGISGSLATSPRILIWIEVDPHP